tara:strand:- start:7621 stop:8490 length:870 start_codon:yes stop_codon:yes gene_type:complete
MSSKYLKFDGDPLDFEQRLFCFVGDGGEDPTGADDDERIEIQERGTLLTPDLGRASRQAAGGGTVNFTVSQQAIDDMNQAGDEDSRQERRETFFGDATTDQRGDTISEAAIDDLLARGFAAGSRITPEEGVQANNRLSLSNNPIANLARSLQNQGAQNIRQQIFAGGTPFTNDQGMIQGAMTPRGGFVGDQSLNPNPPMSGGGDDNQMVQQPPSTGDPQDPGTTPPETIDDAAINYLQNPFYLYSGQGNLYNPYGFAQGTLVDLLRTRGMRQPEQADTLGLFANPRDFM